jgi:endonuclease/exonuclease/phosphatase family metal-dependent hydrolase
MVLRLLSINAWSGLLPRSFYAVESLEPPGNKERRTEALLAGIRELDPDVVFLQECLPQPDFSTRLAGALGYDGIHRICNSGVRLLGVGLPRGIGRGEGLAILAKRHLGLRPAGMKRLSGVGFVSRHLSLQAGPVKFAVAGEILVNGRRVTLVNTHLTYMYPDEAAFRRSWAELVRSGEAKGEPPRWLEQAVRVHVARRDHELLRLGEWMKQLVRRTGRVVLGSDLNLDPDSAQVKRFARSLGLLNVLPAVDSRALTWDPAANPNIAYSTTPTLPDGRAKDLVARLVAEYDRLPQCPDHLMFGPDLGLSVLRQAGLALVRPFRGVFPSDHFGIFAEAALGA